MSAPPIKLRPIRESDIGYVVSCWRRGVEATSQLAKYDLDVFRRLITRHINAVVREAGDSAVAACDPADEETLLGFAVLTGTELHYVYVRSAMAGLGIARAMLDGRAVETYAFRTPAFSRFAPESKGWKFQPRTFVALDGKLTAEMQ